MSGRTSESSSKRGLVGHRTEDLDSRSSAKGQQHVLREPRALVDDEDADLSITHGTSAARPEMSRSKRTAGH